MARLTSMELNGEQTTTVCDDDDDTREEGKVRNFEREILW